MATFKFLCAILLSFQLRDHVIGADNDVACPFDADECTCTFPQSDTAFDSATCISKSSTFPSFNGSRTYSIYNELTIQFGASRIESGALQAFSSIESLTLKEDVGPTPIRQQWQPHAFTGPEINTFRVVNTAGVIPLPAPLREIAENLKELRIVSCREAVDLGANSFSDFKQLRVLEISYTPIVVFSDTTFNGLGETLREIYLQSNKLSYFPTSALKNLVLLYRIDLSDNNIRSFSEDAFSSLSELAFLTLDGNDVQAAIDSGALSNLPQATTSLSLQRSNPALKSIPTKVIRDVPQLVTLSLANNYIDAVRTGDFFNTSQIFSLFLAGNPITTIQPGSLQDLPGLTHLDLSQTALESLDFSLFEGLNNLFAVILDETRTLKSLTISNLDMVREKPAEDFAVTHDCLFVGPTRHPSYQCRCLRRRNYRSRF